MTLTFRDVTNFLALKTANGFFKWIFHGNIGCSGNKSMTLFSLLEDEVGPGVVNTYKSCLIHRGHNPFSNQTGLSNFAMYSTMKSALTVNGKNN